MSDWFDVPVTELDFLSKFNPHKDAKIEGSIDVGIDTKRWNSKMRIMAFDQAIANSGWVVIERLPNKPPVIIDVGTIKTVTVDDRTSWDDTLDRATRIMTLSSELLVAYKVDLVLHEMPPVGQGPFMRAIYSSVVAATSIRCAASSRGLPVEHVSAQAVKKNLTGDGNAKKKEVRKAIDGLLKDKALLVDPDISLRLNEHIVDAIGIALTYQGPEDEK